jgi:hypothetical protein
MKIICKLPNAAEVINGIKFATHKLGMISEEIEEEVAEHFLKIPGYVRVGTPAKATTTDSTASTAAATDTATTAAAPAATTAADASAATAPTAAAVTTEAAK